MKIEDIEGTKATIRH